MSRAEVRSQVEVSAVSANEEADGTVDEEEEEDEEELVEEEGQMRKRAMSSVATTLHVRSERTCLRERSRDGAQEREIESV
jgi:hypothetical protein